MTVAHASFEEAPEGASVIDITTPAVENVVLELSFINEVLHLTANSVQLTLRVDLSETALVVVLGRSHVEVNWIVRGSIPNNVGGVEDSVLLPFSESNVEALLV